MVLISSFEWSAIVLVWCNTICHHWIPYPGPDILVHCFTTHTFTHFIIHTYLISVRTCFFLNWPQSVYHHVPQNKESILYVCLCHVYQTHYLILEFSDKIKKKNLLITFTDCVFRLCPTNVSSNVSCTKRYHLIHQSLITFLGLRTRFITHLGL